MPSRATPDGRVMVESSDKTWFTGEGNGKPLWYSCLESPMNSMKRQKRSNSLRRTTLRMLWQALGAGKLRWNHRSGVYGSCDTGWLHGADSSRTTSYIYWESIDSCAYVNGIKLNHILGTFCLKKCDFPSSYPGGNVMEWSLWSRSAGLCNQAFCLKWLKVEVILKRSTGSLAVEENLPF